MVGDRLDTDIEGARAVGVDSLLVLTGVTGLAELVGARPRTSDRRYLSPDLEGLFEAHATSHPDDQGARLGGWTATVDDGVLVVRGEGDPPTGGGSSPSRAGPHLDATGSVVDVAALEPPVTSDVGGRVASRP